MSSLAAEILAVGSELLTPSKVDTNSLWLTQQLNTLGVEVVAKGIIGDDRTRLTEAVRSAMTRSDVLVITGGLGPTEDDVTRDAVAAALGRGQTFQQELMDAITARFARIQRRMSENNRRQAFLIDGAKALPNDNGTAPGQWIDANGKVVVLLPGPPREMQELFESQCLPRLERLLPSSVIRTRWYRVAGMGESEVDQIIAPAYTQYANPTTTILAGPGDIQIHLRAQCATSDEAESLLEEVGRKIEDLLGDRIYTSTGQTLEAVIGDLLFQRKQKLAVAESLTAGMIGARLTTVSGSGQYFEGGFVTYTDEAKTNLLGVSPELLSSHTAVCEAVAVAMARGAMTRLNTDWSLAVTGYAGPDGGPDGTPAGTVYMAVSSRNKDVCTKLMWAPDRQRVRLLTTTSALDLLRRTLLAAG